MSKDAGFLVFGCLSLCCLGDGGQEEQRLLPQWWRSHCDAQHPLPPLPADSPQYFPLPVTLASGKWNTHTQQEISSVEGSHHREEKRKTRSVRPSQLQRRAWLTLQLGCCSTTTILNTSFFKLSLREDNIFCSWLSESGGLNLLNYMKELSTLHFYSTSILTPFPPHFFPMISFIIISTLHTFSYRLLEKTKKVR